MLEVDLHQAIGHGIIGGGAALLVTLFLLIPRWIFIGMRSDFRHWRERKMAKREAKQAARYSDRKEPSLRRERDVSPPNADD